MHVNSLSSKNLWKIDKPRHNQSKLQPHFQSFPSWTAEFEIRSSHPKDESGWICLCSYIFPGEISPMHIHNTLFKVELPKKANVSCQMMLNVLRKTMSQRNIEKLGTSGSFCGVASRQLSSMKKSRKVCSESSAILCWRTRGSAAAFTVSLCRNFHTGAASFCNNLPY